MYRKDTVSEEEIMRAVIYLLLVTLFAAPSAFAAEEGQRRLSAKGSILSQDIFEGELVMLLNENGNYRELTYRIYDDTDITLDGKTATLQELERGYVMKVEYTREGELRHAHKVAAFDYPEPPPIAKVPNQEEPIALLELLPLFSQSPESQAEAVNAAEFVSIPSRTKTFPKATGSFVRQRWLNEDQFIVRNKGRWFWSRDTFKLEEGASVYRDDRLSKIDQLRRGDYVEVVYQRDGDNYLALEINSETREKEVIANNNN
jgi:hypothetical protein